MKFREAVHQATLQALEKDPKVLLIGVGIIDPRAVWGTLSGALEKYGPDRVIEGPLAEDALTGISIGAATMGLKPVIVHHRIDFVMLTMNQLINHAAKWPAMFGFQQKVPMVVRAVVGRGWGNGPQHTQSHHALFSHVPGIKAVVPSNPRDAKGLYLAAIEDGGPVVYIEHRWFHEDDAEVPSEYYVTPIGKAAVVRQGKDITLIAVGPMVAESLKAALSLENTGISAEVIDVRTVHPLDISTILQSVKKTGRVVVSDSDWGPCGVAGEIVASVSENAHSYLKSAPARIFWPDTCVPSSQAIEAMFYPGAKEIETAALKACGRQDVKKESIPSTVKKFEGPF